METSKRQPRSHTFGTEVEGCLSRWCLARATTAATTLTSAPHPPPCSLLHPESKPSPIGYVNLSLELREYRSVLHRTREDHDSDFLRSPVCTHIQSVHTSGRGRASGDSIRQGLKICDSIMQPSARPWELFSSTVPECQVVPGLSRGRQTLVTHHSTQTVACTTRAQSIYGHACGRRTEAGSAET
jgi:hypothetical protein